MKRLIVAVVLFVASSVASAFTPSSGFWYNPSESGRGFNIEIQNNVMAVASYVYDQHGNPIWYTSDGIYDEATQTFTGTFDTAVGGQCLGCSYVRPVLTSGVQKPGSSARPVRSNACSSLSSGARSQASVSPVQVDVS